ncbi:DoxX family protein [Nocardia sp. NPDC057668]|uniref:DoxX family protein n=1 Tax=Nocardia sp. NPDC057668 TaxID=3346202 RepID=UPI00367243A4
MSTRTIDAEPERAEPARAPEAPPSPAWNPLARIGFRFVVAYVTLFCFGYPQLVFAFLGPLARLLPDDAVFGFATLPSPAVEWLGRTAFDTEAVLSEDSGSGDQTYLWVLVFGLLLLAVAVTVLWTLLDRRRTEYRRLAGWFLLLTRMFLAGQMLFYGFVKLIPTQMPEPALSTLLTPVGELSPMSMLWTQVGSAPAYQILLGAAEVLGGLLLLVPRTALAGVLLSLVSMAQVWVLNMTFDVPVKLLSFHLLLLCLVLLAPEAGRLTRLLTGAAAGPARTPQPVRGRRAVRVVAAAQVALAVWFVAGILPSSLEGWEKWGGGRERSPLAGIWDVTEFTRDGQPVPPLLTDETRWRRLVLEEIEFAHYQRMDDGLVPVALDLDTAAHRLTLTSMQAADPAATPEPLGAFGYEQPAPDRLLLTGELAGRPVSITLTLLDADRYPLRRGGIHLVQDFPDLG